jgi:RHS repeat-associated protein
VRKTCTRRAEFLDIRNRCTRAVADVIHRARYYDPSNGRFNQRDTFQGNGYDPQSLHKYAYASCDPVNRIDPSGNWDLITTIAAVSIVIGLATFTWLTVVKKQNPLDAAIIAAAAGAFTFFCLAFLPEICAGLAEVAVGSTIGGIGVAALLAFFTKTAYDHLREISDILFIPGHSAAERRAALLELAAFALLIAVSAEAVSPGSGAMSEYQSVLRSNEAGLEKLANEAASNVKVAPEGGWAGSRGTSYYGGFDPATGKLYLGQDHFGGMAAAGGTPAPSVTPGITVFETETSVIWANDSVSLRAVLTPEQAAQIQAALEAFFPGKNVTRVPVVR